MSQNADEWDNQVPRTDRRCAVENSDKKLANDWERESLLKPSGKSASSQELNGATGNYEDREEVSQSIVEQEFVVGDLDQNSFDTENRNKAIASCFVLIAVAIWLAEIEVTRNLFGSSIDHGDINSYFLMWMARNLYIFCGFGTAWLLCFLSQDEKMYAFFVWQPTRKNLVTPHFASSTLQTQMPPHMTDAVQVLDGAMSTLTILCGCERPRLVPQRLQLPDAAHFQGHGGYLFPSPPPPKTPSSTRCAPAPHLHPMRPHPTQPNLRVGGAGAGGEASSFEPSSSESADVPPPSLPRCVRRIASAERIRESEARRTPPERARLGRRARCGASSSPRSSSPSPPPSSASSPSPSPSPASPS